MDWLSLFRCKESPPGLLNIRGDSDCFKTGADSITASRTLPHPIASSAQARMQPFESEELKLTYVGWLCMTEHQFKVGDLVRVWVSVNARPGEGAVDAIT